MPISSPDRGFGVLPPSYRLPAAARLGPVTIQVSRLAHSTTFYREVLGLRVLEGHDRTARLGPHGEDRVLVVLVERPGARAMPRGGRLGLYHFAILLPDRPALARFVRHLLALGLRFGSADHVVSESTYLWDPDNLGIEVYADRPRETWQTRDRELVMGTDALDLRDLVSLDDGAPWAGMPAGTRLGHMHLSVGDLDAARAFYHAGLGLDLVVWSYPGALFLSAGGYHHHLGANTWAARARPAEDDEARLLEWELVVPAAADVEAAVSSLRRAGYESHEGVAIDPWGTRLRLRDEDSSAAHERAGVIPD